MSEPTIFTVVFTDDTYKYTELLAMQDGFRGYMRHVNQLQSKRSRDDNSDIPTIISSIKVDSDDVRAYNSLPAKDKVRFIEVL